MLLYGVVDVVGVVSSTHTTHFNTMCCCMVLWVNLFRVPTTTHFNKVCCYMVLWVLFRVPHNNTF